jgi:ribosome biogenesis GTPase / thiamine phosphate phosphatase
MRDLNSLGWNDSFEQEFQSFARGAASYSPARVALEQRGAYKLYTTTGEVTASTTGKLRFDASSPSDLPAVGDWVVVTNPAGKARAQIHLVLKRRSRFSRKAAGANAQEQVVAANVDTVFLVQGLDHDFNLRRLERYLVASYESGASPVVVLSKSDLCEDSKVRLEEVESIAPGVPAYAISSITGEGLADLNQYIRTGITVAFLGSSGVGKSTLINRIVGEEIQKTATVREHDSRGRHTTTHRELIVLEGGGLLIDTPGMRELQLWDASDSLGEAFSDIESIATACYFTDCQHKSEPGCAVREALADGSLDASRYENYLKMEREIEYLDSRMDEKLNLRRKDREKKIHRAYRTIKNRKM